MKKGYITTLVLMLVSVIATIVFLSILPETVPLRFDLQGSITHFGSKFGYLLVPLFQVLLGSILLIVAKNARGHEKKWLIGAIVTVSLITAALLAILLRITFLELLGI